MSEKETKQALDFIRQKISQDIDAEKIKNGVVTRFPPEPNGYLHIGHAKSICLNFGIALEQPKGICHLRFDDTNPTKEEEEYVGAIKEDIRWLGFDWGENLFYTSDYYQKLYEAALELIKMDKAYVDHLNAEEMRKYRGTLTEPGKDSPHRSRSPEENLKLFDKMKKGDLEEGSCVLRAKIDMSSPNINMRDPVIYRILKEYHHRTGNNWCIYPMYDFAHSLSDSFEGITHSICTLEFENHRPLYDWFLDTLNMYHPQQIEFARLNLNYTVMSKRKLLELVEKKIITGWDDPRMPTISGLRRRGYTPETIRAFCERIGVAKVEGTIDVALLEYCLREDLNRTAPRVMGVLRPLKVVIENYPEGDSEDLEAINNPEDPEAGKRNVPFSRELYIERDDFQEEPHKKFFRLAPGREVRLRYAYFLKCEKVIKDETTGEILELRCTYDPATKGGHSPEGRKVKGTIHWVSVEHAKKVQVNLYDRLFVEENPLATKETGSFLDSINPDSLEILDNCYVEPSLVGAEQLSRFQFERLGYFCVDPQSTQDNLVFNRTVALRDPWAKIAKK